MHMVTDELLRSVFHEVLRQYKLPLSGIHGVAHWGRVLENGLKLMEGSGANADIVKLFALLHDSRRMNEDRDPDHGERGAELARSLQGKIYTLPQKDLDLLCDSCALHTLGKLEADITVQTCWDADRLDLRRVGHVPDPRRLCTSAAKDPAMIEWASRRSLAGHVTEFAQLLLQGTFNDRRKVD